MARKQPKEGTHTVRLELPVELATRYRRYADAEAVSTIGAAVRQLAWRALREWEASRKAKP